MTPVLQMRMGAGRERQNSHDCTRLTGTDNSAGTESQGHLTPEPELLSRMPSCLLPLSCSPRREEQMRLF